MADDDDEKPRLRVVSENPAARADRQTAWAKEEAQRTLAQFAAALLRTMAGGESESIYLIRRLADFIDAMNKFREESGHGLTVADLQAELRLPETEFDSSDEDWRHRQWLREHGMEVIVQGALRLAAHKILGERPAFGGKNSERVIELGIRTLDELKRPPPSPKLRSDKKDLAHSWDDIDPGAPHLDGKSEQVFGQWLEGAGPARALRRRHKAQGFSQEDLKELRKAIKAKDKERIAELTSKIGNPSFDEK
jgi:hypothetical protein